MRVCLCACVVGAKVNTAGSQSLLPHNNNNPPLSPNNHTTPSPPSTQPPPPPPPPLSHCLVPPSPPHIPWLGDRPVWPWLDLLLSVRCCAPVRQAALRHAALPLSLGQSHRLPAVRCRVTDRLSTGRICLALSLSLYLSLPLSISLSFPPFSLPMLLSLSLPLSLLSLSLLSLSLLSERTE